MNWQNFFHMGGYAVYVWSSYGIAALLLVGNLWLSLRQQHRIIKAMKKRLHPATQHQESQA